MDTTPTGPMPIDPTEQVSALPPPTPRPAALPHAASSDRWPTMDDTAWFPPLDGTVRDTDLHSRATMDSTSDQPEGSIRRRRFTGSKLLSEDAFQNLRHHLATLGLALLLALPVAALVFFTVAAVRFAFDDRTFWNSQSNALAQFWYALALFVIVATPATFILLRRGYRAAAEFVVDRGYWKILLTIYVVLPLTVGVITVVAGHLVAVLVVLVLLLLFVVLNGGI